MLTGKLDQQIDLQSPATINDGGDAKTTYTTVSTVFGQVTSQHGSEAFEAARMSARETIRVQIRYRDDVLTTWRIVWMNQNYSIKSVDRSMRRKGELWLTAEVSGAK